MSEMEKKTEKKQDAPAKEAELSPEMIRRNFIKRFGVYSAGTHAGLFVLMSARTSKVLDSDGGP